MGWFKLVLSVWYLSCNLPYLNQGGKISSHIKNLLSLQMGGGSYTMDHGNRPIFLYGIWKIVYMLVNLGNRNTDGHGNLLFLHVSNGCFEMIGAEVGDHTPGNPPRNRHTAVKCNFLTFNTYLFVTLWQVSFFYVILIIIYGRLRLIHSSKIRDFW